MTNGEWRPGKRIVIAGGGPGAISAALAFINQGFDVRVYERQQECKPIGGGVLINIPVLMVLRSYGVSIDNLGAYTVTHFSNQNGDQRVTLPFHAEAQEVSGIKGWHYGVLRSSLFKKMLDRVPEGIIHTGFEFKSFQEFDDQVHVEFTNGETVVADMLVGADGVRSAVSKQLFGPSGLFHVGIRLYLAWCDYFPGIEPNLGVIHHSRDVQASFFPMMHEGKPGFEWWIVEPSYEGKEVPTDIKGHISDIVRGFSHPMSEFIDKTDFDNNVYRWEIYNRPAMKKWSRGRVVCIGDAVHPVSPYAAYGLGMAVEDGYYLARALKDVDLRDLQAVTKSFTKFEGERVDYVNHNMLFARRLGYIFHKLPWPLSSVRDFFFDHTPLLSLMMSKGYLAKSEQEVMGLTELFVPPYNTGKPKASSRI
ncbi:probable 2-polyprenyl-6-methoxyphenol hydroxylase and related FAD-dependent oxidoreductases [Melanopsichium pennsylvanicum]|uniref:Salicylate hydroxylase n=2 Tax=Melanopsichium pennsylvanicum TaxID=63383 RepID=A0A077R8F5_9BASI|nr:salicylate hydroxylase [Melanopsichium pennsylvanicum 4]SNX86752.1 probable 2-polyprenyl-6-methoxyphenol hydroxylase and related FAD-dependent oxidoreductases [Melanopsichium pennsylvanicum]